VRAADYEKYFHRYMLDIEEPVGHESAPAFYFVSALARDHVKVALTGQGADEPWAGYARYLGVRLSAIYSRLPVGVTRSIEALAKRLPLPSERLKRGVVAMRERDLLLRFVKTYSFFNDEMKASLYNEATKRALREIESSPADSIRHLQSDVAHMDPVSQILYIDVRASLPDDLLMVGDKTSMANSLELRVPFLDSRLIEFIESLPPHLKLSGTTGKYLHKKALLKWLPKEDVYRRKIGFSNPVGKWFRTSMRALVDDCLLAKDSRVSRYFDPQFIRQILNADRQGRENYTRQIYLLVSFELWHRAFIA
jgi:asparagine synthase (glutamine-hydrolysing)